MALDKQNVQINFAQGLDTKTDPKQVQIGKFLDLENSIFTKAGLLSKRNGYTALPPISANALTTLATYSDNLIAIGDTVQVLSSNAVKWFDKGIIQPVDLSVIPVVRTSGSQTMNDVAVASTGLACAVYVELGIAYYQILDSSTSQIIINTTALPSTAANPRVFALGKYFVITFLRTVVAATHLEYIAIPISQPNNPGTAQNLSLQAKNLAAGYDGIVANNNLYVAVSGSDLGGSIRITYIDQILNQHNTVIIAGHSSDLMSATADESGNTPIIWFTFWDITDGNGYTVAYNQILVPVLAPTQVITAKPLNSLTSLAIFGVNKIFYETAHLYSYGAAVTDFLSSVSCTQLGVVGATAVILRSVGLASKAFYFPLTAQIYMLTAYGGQLQPTYFLIDQFGNIIAKLAYSNGGGYMTTEVLPSVTVTGSLVQIGYLFKDLLVSVNKAQGVATSTGVYSQTGVNLASFSINTSKMIPAEIGNDLHLTGGFLWMYDGSKAVEHGFHVWPENIFVTTSPVGGFLTAQTYFYQVTYEWTDAQGNLHRSAPSVPFQITTAGPTSSNTINVPMLRLTYKSLPNDARIVIYRWSTAQQIFYQITSITNPILNDPTIDSVAYTDTVPDANILGDIILYTTGGVVEDIAAPACTTLTLFKSRLILVDAENQNLLWYSKQVIQATPVEMSDLFTIYVAPTTGAQGSTGPIRALSVLDDKLIIFKKDAIYYITGNGPDNTGANNDFSDPIFITATVGCMNQQSIVFMPQGLMFQSDKGIWLLGRDLNTTYIGAPVEEFNSSIVVAAINVPGTNQVRFTLDDGKTLMYDYYFGQWGTFTNIPAISSTLYQGLHTYLNSFGEIFQESPGKYIDGSNPVLMAFTTSWFNLAGVQGFERAYEFYLIGEYITPHKLNVQVAYDYNPYPAQTNLIVPDNFNPKYGLQPGPYGSGSPYGGNPTLEQWRVFLARQKCQSFQITLTEVYDSTFGVAAGAGFTLSGIDLTVGIKLGRPKLSAARQVG